jgi:dihydrolipoamide dehydrogenase
MVLIAIGVAPNSEVILETAGVATDNGFIVIDENLRTNVPGIYAIRTSPAAVTHVASARGRRRGTHSRHERAPSRVRTTSSCRAPTPQVAVSATRAQARRRFRVKIGRFRLSPTARRWD